MTFSEWSGTLLLLLILVVVNGFRRRGVHRQGAFQPDRPPGEVGHRGAVLAQNIVDHLDAYLSATQLGITFASLLGWAGEPILPR